MAPAPQSRSNLLIAGTVAIAILLIAIAEGGYSIEARAMLALLVWSALIGGLAFGLLPRSRLPDAALIGASLLALVALLAGLSVAWANDDGTVVNEFIRASFYLGLFMFIVCVSREGEMRGWLAGLALGIVLVAVVAALSRLIPALPGGDQALSRLLPSARGRLSFPIGYWNGLAALTTLGLLLLVWFSAFARTLAGRAASTGLIPVLGLDMYLTSSRGGFAALAFGLIVLFALGPRRPVLVGSALLGTIGAGLVVLLANGQAELLDAGSGHEATKQGLLVLAGLLGSMALAGAARTLLDGELQRFPFPPERTRLAAAVGIAIVLIGLIAANPPARFDEFKSVPAAEKAQPTQGFVSAHLTNGNGTGRWQFWGAALNAFGSEPIHGIGAGGFGNYWNEHANINQPARDAHSLYLEQLGELGPLVPLALIGFLLLGPVRALQDRRIFRESDEVAAAVAVIASGALSAGIDWTWELPAVFAPVVVAVALLCGPTLVLAARAHFSDSSGSATEPRRAPRRGPFAWWAALIALGALTWLLAWSSLLSQRSIDSSQQAVADNDLQKAADDARDAIELQPWASEPRLQLALVQENAADLSQADQTIQDAINRAPNDWELWLVRTRIALGARHIPKAAAYLGQAKTLNPRAPVIRKYTKRLLNLGASIATQ